jgi:hypothetical protein
MKSKVTQTTESSSTCTTLYPNGKISLKTINNSHDQSYLNKKIQGCYYLNIKYEDIKTDKKIQHRNFLNHLLCSQVPIKNTMGCSCHMKCPWREKWMSRVPDNLHSKPFNGSGLKSIDPSVLSQIEKDLKRTQP